MTCDTVMYKLKFHMTQTPDNKNDSSSPYSIPLQHVHNLEAVHYNQLSCNHTPTMSKDFSCVHYKQYQEIVRWVLHQQAEKGNDAWGQEPFKDTPLPNVDPTTFIIAIYISEHKIYQWQIASTILISYKWFDHSKLYRRTKYTNTPG